MKEKPNFIKSIFPGKMEGLRNVIKDKLVKSKVRTLTNTFSVLNMHKGQFYVVWYFALFNIWQTYIHAYLCLP